MNKVYVVQESDYDHAMTHTLAFTNQAAAEQYAKQVKAKLDAAALENWNILNDMHPDLFSDVPKTSSVFVDILVLDVTDAVPSK